MDRIAGRPGAVRGAFADGGRGTWPGADVGHIVDALVATVSRDASVAGVLLGPPTGRNRSLVTDATLYVVLADDAILSPTRIHELAKRIGTPGVIDHTAQLVSCLCQAPSLHVALAIVRRQRVSRVRGPVRVMWWRDTRAGMSPRGARHDAKPGASAVRTNRRTEPRGRGRLMYSATAGDALFWILLHSAIRKTHRGELLEGIKLLDSARTTRLAPLAGLVDGRLGAGGCQWFERLHPDWVEPFSRTVARYSSDACLHACGEALRLYTDLYARAAGEHAPAAAIVAAAMSRFIAASLIPSSDNEADVPHHVSAFLASAMPVFEAESDVLGVGVIGAWTHNPHTPVSGRLDRHSDLDLLVLVPPAKRRDPEWQKTIANRLARCYVLQRRKDQCLMGLYGDPLVHVDTMFCSADALESRFEDPVVLWERNRCFSDALRSSAPDPARHSLWPQSTAQSIESQVWRALLDCTTRLRRGELFQAIYDLARVRSTSLGPLASVVGGELCRGVRRLEFRHPALVERFAVTVPSYDAEACWRAIEASIALYRDLRQQVSGPLVFRSKVEQPLAAWLQSCH